MFLQFFLCHSTLHKLKKGYCILQEKNFFLVVQSSKITFQFQLSWQKIPEMSLFHFFSVILAFFENLAHPNGYANEAYPKQKLLLLWSLLLKTKGQIL